MPYKSTSDMNPALKGIHPPISLSQANEIAREADAIGSNNDKNGWAIAISNFKKRHIVKNGRWVRKESMSKDFEMEYELERKFELNGIPPESQLIDKIHIQQSYASFNPIVRIRKIIFSNNNIEFFHCVKYWKAENSRAKINSDIGEDDYNSIFNWIALKPVEKDRFIYNIGNGLIAKVDYFSTGTSLVEVEFSNKDIMNSFIAPTWFGEEYPPFFSMSIDCFNKINGTYENKEPQIQYSRIIDKEKIWI